MNMTRNWLLVAENNRTRLLCAPTAKDIAALDETLSEDSCNDFVMFEHNNIMIPQIQCSSTEEPTTMQKHDMVMFVNEIGSMLGQRLQSFDLLHLVTHASMRDVLMAVLPVDVQAKIPQPPMADENSPLWKPQQPRVVFEHFV